MNRASVPSGVSSKVYAPFWPSSNLSSAETMALHFELSSLRWILKDRLECSALRVIVSESRKLVGMVNLVQFRFFGR